MGHAPGGLRIGGERVGRSRPVPHRLRDPLQSDEGRIRVGGERERRRHHGEHVRQDLADPRGGSHEPLERLERARGLCEPEPGEELLGGLAVVSGRRVDRAGERLEERPVEESLVDPSDELRRAVVLGLQGVGAGEPERTSEGRARVSVGREVMGLQVAHHLQPVLQSPQEAIGVRKGGRVLVRHVTLVRERGERGERVRVPEPMVPPPVDDLEELHRELDVADAAAAALHLGELLAAAPDVLLEPDLRSPDVVDRGFVQVPRIDELGDPFDERIAERSISHRGSGLDHGLAFPGGGLAIVVRERGGQGANQGSGATPGSERQVDPEGDPIGGGIGEVGDQVGGGGLRHVAADVLAIEEQEVDVARVVELPAAELAERDDRLAVRARLRETRVGHVADLTDDLLEGRATEVAGGDAEHRPPAESAEAGGGAVPPAVAPELLVELSSIPGSHVGERVDLLGMPDQQVARRRREAEQS